MTLSGPFSLRATRRPAATTGGFIAQRCAIGDVLDGLPFFRARIYLLICAPGSSISPVPYAGIDTDYAPGTQSPESVPVISRTSGLSMFYLPSGLLPPFVRGHHVKLQGSL
jgi:hypothetical protein